jgi:hypothetical protein
VYPPARGLGRIPRRRRGNFTNVNYACFKPDGDLVLRISPSIQRNNWSRVSSRDHKETMPLCVRIFLQEDLGIFLCPFSELRLVVDTFLRDRFGTHQDGTKVGGGAKGVLNGRLCWDAGRTTPEI